jgi:hypothetical protein
VPSSNEHVVEIRYQPTARVLDHRGAWAETLSARLELPRWQIAENRLDVFEPKRTRACFLSFRNFGFVALDSPTRNYFADQAGKFVRTVFSLEQFGTRLPVTRIGVRSRFCDPFEGSFDELRDRFTSRYVSIAGPAQQAIGQDAQLLDVGAPLNYRDQLGKFNTVSGPMTADQFRLFFQKDEGFPPVGLFYDIDYFKEPNAEMKADEVVHVLTDFAGTAWDRHDRIKTLIVGA